MARTKDRAKAVMLRLKGYSYSQIKAELGISKSTLSNWLQNMPLSPSRIRALRDNNQVRIEKSKLTKLATKENRRHIVYEKVARDIETSQDKNFVAGFYLYWGEGTKSAEYTVAITNTDPAIVVCFIEWLKLLSVDMTKLSCKLHLYSDQDEELLKKFWSKKTGIPKTKYYKSHIKESRQDAMTYKGMFGFGTCTVFYHNRDIHEYVLAGVEYLRNKYTIVN